MFEKISTSLVRNAASKFHTKEQTFAKLRTGNLVNSKRSVTITDNIEYLFKQGRSGDVLHVLKKAENPDHIIPGEIQDNLKLSFFLKPDGDLLKDVRDVVLASVVNENGTLCLKSAFPPVQPINGGKPNPQLDEPYAELAIKQLHASREV